jgi:FkbM family methyltransferase
VFFGTFVTESVLAIEPNPTVLSALRHNLNANIQNWDIVACGLADADGYADIVEPRGELNLGMARLSTSTSRNCHGIPTRTLDSVVQDALYNSPRRNVTLIKIDVEGMEYDVLRGAEYTLNKFRPELLVEALDEEAFTRIAAFLQPFGYFPLSRWCHSPVYHFSIHHSFIRRLAVTKYILMSRASERLKRLATRSSAFASLAEVLQNRFAI